MKILTLKHAHGVYHATVLALGQRHNIVAVTVDDLARRAAKLDGTTTKSEALEDITNVISEQLEPVALPQ